VKLFLSASAELAWFTSGPVLGLNSYFRSGAHRDEQTSVSAPVIVVKNSCAWLITPGCHSCLCLSRVRWRIAEASVYLDHSRACSWRRS